MRIAFFSLFLCLAHGGPNCDDALGAGLCPDAFSLEEIGECLKANRAKLDDGCKIYTEVNEVCASALARCGDGIAWSPDALLCVTTWTKAIDLSSDCSDAVAKITADEPSSGSGQDADEEVLYYIYIYLKLYLTIS